MIHTVAHHLKNHFIPHEGNEYRPHLLRKESIRNMLFIVLFFELTTFAVPMVALKQVSYTQTQLATVLPATLAMLTNDERLQNHLPPLETNPLLDKAAQLKAEDMAKNEYFAHTSPTGVTPWHWFDTVGYDYQYAGENLAINFTDSAEVTRAWMNSPAHKANIVKNSYTEVGTGLAVGTYKGHQTIFVAQLYGHAFPETTKNTPKTEKTLSQVPQSQKTVYGKITERDAKNIPKNVLGAEVTAEKVAIQSLATPEMHTTVETRKNTLWSNLFSSPKHTTQTILLALFGIVVCALVLNSVVKFKEHHPDLIIGGLIVLVVIGLVLVLNERLVGPDMRITDTVHSERTAPSTME